MPKEGEVERSQGVRGEKNNWSYFLSLFRLCVRLSELVREKRVAMLLRFTLIDFTMLLHVNDFVS